LLEQTNMSREQIAGAFLAALITGACGPLGGEGSAAPGAGGSQASYGNGGTGPETVPTAINTPNTPPIDGEFSTLRQAADASGHLIGIAIQANRMNNGSYSSTALQEFNYVTPENEMKWNSLQPNPGQFNFGPADRIVAFAEQNGMKVKGHTLVWHSQLPNWVAALTTPDEVRAAMLNHIDTVVSHFKGRIYAWDVVNEAWQNGNALRTSVFMQQLGAGFIDEAFIAAKAADPDAKLYYNDFGAEGTGGKANAIYNMVQGMLQRGVPIDGVGLQMHTGSANANPTISAFQTNMQRIRELGLEVVVSELDVQTCTDTSPMDVRMDVQRSRYYDIVSACVDEVGCSAVTIWGVIDGLSWLNNNQQSQNCRNTTGQLPLPLLFDDAYQRKPAYGGVMDALLGR
jgi:endo-1,4-beta-xylanase